MAKRITTEIFIDRVQKANLEMYNKCDYTNTIYTKLSEKVTVVCKEHGEFEVWPGDHMRGLHGCKPCIADKRAATMIERYGVDNYFKRNDLIQEAMIAKHGVSNPGLLDDHVEKVKSTSMKNYGVEWASTADSVNERRKKTNIERYGTETPTKNKTVAMKIGSTKTKNGAFGSTNSSKEATEYILRYIDEHEYTLDQCAFNHPEEGLYEWGYFYSGKWRLFDLVVFEQGHRGDKDKIIEILEYHGPFHYTKEDVATRGNDMAYPWKTKRTTIKESFDVDTTKEELAKMLCDKFTVIWAKDEKTS